MYKKRSTKDAIKLFKSVHGDSYDYSKFEYVKHDTAGIIICPKHGEFRQSFGNHLRGSKCPKCSLEDKKKKTFKYLCKIKGVDYYRALKRRQAGLPDNKIFEEGYVRNTREINPITVFGKKYPNIEEAIRIINPPASARTIIRWIDEGKSSDEAFTKMPNPGYENGKIYLITNIVTNKQYVGQTIQNLDARWQKHIEDAKAESIRNEESLHHAIREYGPKSFKLEIIDRGIANKDLERKEKQWIAYYDTLVPKGYNILRSGASGGSNKKPIKIDNINFDSIKSATQYVSQTRNISVDAAKRRIRFDKIDIKGHAKRGTSMIKTKIYKTWSSIVHVYTNPNSKGYIPGLYMEERWKDFKDFYTDIGDPPSKDLVFARIDKKVGFIMDNCRWMTKSEASKINAAYMIKEGKMNRRFKNNSSDRLPKISTTIKSINHSRSF